MTPQEDVVAKNLTIITEDEARARDAWCATCEAPATHEVDGDDPRCAACHARAFVLCDHCGASVYDRDDTWRYRHYRGGRDEPSYDEVVGCYLCKPDESDEPDWDQVSDWLEGR